MKTWKGGLSRQSGKRKHIKILFWGQLVDPFTHLLLICHLFLLQLLYLLLLVLLLNLSIFLWCIWVRVRDHLNLIKTLILLGGHFTLGLSRLRTAWVPISVPPLVQVFLPSSYGTEYWADWFSAWSAELVCCLWTHQTFSCWHLDLLNAKCT